MYDHVTYPYTGPLSKGAEEIVLSDDDDDDVIDDDDIILDTVKNSAKGKGGRCHVCDLRLIDKAHKERSVVVCCCCCQGRTGRGVWGV